MDDDSALGGYVSSVEPFAPEKGKPSVDAADEKALVRLVRAVDSQIKLYHTISGMKQFDVKKFDAEEREAMCAQHVQLLVGLKQLLNNAIDGVKEAGK
jgi:hypothetical protein